MVVGLILSQNILRSSIKLAQGVICNNDALLLTENVVTFNRSSAQTLNH